VVPRLLTSSEKTSDPMPISRSSKKARLGLTLRIATEGQKIYLLLTSHLKIATHFVFYKFIGRKNLRSEGRGLGVIVQYVTKSLISSPLQCKFRTLNRKSNIIKDHNEPSTMNKMSVSKSTSVTILSLD
jgi:hypothetical protein